MRTNEISRRNILLIFRCARYVILFQIRVILMQSRLIQNSKGKQ